MKLAQAIQLIRDHEITDIRLADLNHMNKGHINDENTEGLIYKLENTLPLLSECRKVVLESRPKADSRSNNTFYWTIDLEPEEKKVAATAIAGGIGFGSGFGINEIIGLVKAQGETAAELREMKMKMELQAQIDKLNNGGGIEKTLEKFGPAISMVAMKMFGLSTDEMKVAFNPAAKVAGPETISEAKNTETFTEKQEEDTAKKCINKLVDLRQKGWNPDQILALLSACVDLTSVKAKDYEAKGKPAAEASSQAAADLVELVERGVKMPAAIDDAIIFLRIKQA